MSVQRARKVPLYSYVNHPALDKPYPLPPFVSQEKFDSAVKFKPDSGDLILASYPKNGTTWLSNILYLMRNDGVPVPEGDQLNNYFPYLEFHGGDVAAKQPTPRLIKTHLCWELTPYNPEVKYIFIARNPKDVVVSFYCHTVGFEDMYKFKDGSFDDYFEVFINGDNCEFGDYFKMVPEWWQKSLQQDKIYFMLYEDMKNDIKGELLKLADFLGESCRESLERNNDELLNKVIEFSSFFKMQESVKTFCTLRRPDDIPFVRKGVVGDWKKHLSREQSDRIDKRLAEAGIQFPGFDKLWSKYDKLLIF